MGASGTLSPFDYTVSAIRSEPGDRHVPSEMSGNLAYSSAEGRLENTAFDSRYITIEATWRDSPTS
ncbi:MAG: hypothetical protein DIJKHBIC_03290 [Thermoanaerobaculia bacterium]|nr:hypothetical protein [Thermoanaerobaculia bacterium]